MFGIAEAADTVLRAIDEEQNIMIYADVDMDGVAAGAIMYRYLSNFTDQLYVTINQGKLHGINPDELDYMDDIGLLIIVDAIEGAPDYYKAILDKGINIVVLDHHIIPECIVQSELDIHLVSSANNYPNPELSGAGVAWKFAAYLDYVTLNTYAQDLMDLAACGIIADMCDLSEKSMENRYICAEGIKRLRNPALKQICGGYEFTSQTVSFSIAPLINSAMRTGKNELALDVFLIDIYERITEILNTLKEAKQEQDNTVKEILPSLTASADEQKDKKCLVLQIPEEYAGITGLIANRMLSEYKKPVLIVRDHYEIDPETGEIIGEPEYRGSGRGYGVDDFKQLFTKTGIGWSAGHENAFGVKLKQSELESWSDAIEDQLSNVDFDTSVYADVLIDPEQVTNEMISRFKAINTVTGNGFQPITFCVKDIEDYQISYLSDGKHLKIKTPNLTIIQWNSDIKPEKGSKITAIGTLDANIFNRTVTKQLIASEIIVE